MAWGRATMRSTQHSCAGITCWKHLKTGSFPADIGLEEKCACVDCTYWPPDQAHQASIMALSWIDRWFLSRGILGSYGNKTITLIPGSVRLCIFRNVRIRTLGELLHTLSPYPYAVRLFLLFLPGGRIPRSSSYRFGVFGPPTGNLIPQGPLIFVCWFVAYPPP